MVTSADILHAKILIVDDLEANVMLLQQMLKSAGYDQVDATSDPTEVCERHLVNRYDLILLDLQMPGMDGFQVMENLKEIETGGYLPVLVITAQPQHKLRALQVGARDFVSKPFDLPEVLLRVRNMIEVRLLHLETRKLYEALLAEKNVSARLLLETLPPRTAEKLASKSDEVVTGSYAELTMLFSQLAEFTRFSEGAGAQVLTGVLESLADRVDGGADPIGGAWLAAVGLPDAVAAHTVRAAQKAVDLKAAVESFNARSSYQLQFRVGLQTGAAVGPAETKKGRRTRSLK
ncbi:MAG: response regulator [Archangium sp.]|nr:response regulator [Archangium sp.]MDP3158029.1 response regulator [Archangium sp.]MDP3570565.1 response regulator [Archangium sp.]